MENLVRPICCEDEMTFVMDNKAKAAWQCLKCWRLLIKHKQTGEETWYGQISGLTGLLKQFPHLSTK